MISIRRWTARNVVADTLSGWPGFPRRRCRPSQSSGLGARAQYRSRRCGRSGLEARGHARGLGRRRPARLLRDRAPSGRRAQCRPCQHDLRHRPDPEPASGDRAAPPPLAPPRATPWARRSCARRPRKFITDGIALGYRYDPSPICWPERGPAPPLTISEYHPTSYPGSRAPHAWLSPGRSILDAFGRGFTLVRLGGDARIRARSSRPSRRGRCRSPSWRSRTRRSPRSMSGAWCWCGLTATWHGAPTRCPPTRPRWSTACAVALDARRPIE